MYLNVPAGIFFFNFILLFFFHKTHVNRSGFGQQRLKIRLCLIPLSALHPQPSTSPRWPAPPVTAQLLQLPCLFTVKVLTNRESCQYRGSLIRVWLAHEKPSYMCALGALLACATAGSSPTTPAPTPARDPARSGAGGGGPTAGQKTPGLTLGSSATPPLPFKQMWAPLWHRAAAAPIQTCESDTN